MKHIHKKLFIVIIPIIFICMIILVATYRMGYGYAESKDGKWRAYLIPAVADVLISGRCVVIYQGNDSGNVGDIDLCIGKNNIDEFKEMKENGEEQDETYSCDPEKRTWREFIEMNVYNKKYYYLGCFIEYEQQPEYEILVVWKEDGIDKEAELKISYKHKWKYTYHWPEAGEWFGHFERLS